MSLNCKSPLWASNIPAKLVHFSLNITLHPNMRRSKVLWASLVHHTALILWTYFFFLFFELHIFKEWTLFKCLCYFLGILSLHLTLVNTGDFIVIFFYILFFKNTFWCILKINCIGGMIWEIGTEIHKLLILYIK